jgi:hypothetical protein
MTDQVRRICPVCVAALAEPAEAPLRKLPACLRRQ